MPLSRHPQSPSGPLQGDPRGLRGGHHRDRVPAAAGRRRAVVHAAHLRARPRPDGQGHGRAGRGGHRLRAAQQRHRPRGRQGPGRPGAGGRRRRGVSLDGGSGQGFELFDEQKLGASDFQQKVTYQRALEGEIARTIGGVEGVTSPQVQLVLPEDDLFADEASPATAAVMLGNSSDTMDSGRRAASPSSSPPPSRALRPTTSPSPTHSGSLLWPAGDGSARGGVAAGKQALEARYSRAMEADLNAMLVRDARPGQGPGRGHRRPERGQDQQRRGRVREEGHAAQESTETEKLKGGGTTTGGTAGTGSNIPTYSRAPPAAARTRTTSARPRAPTSASARRSPRTEVAPGAVNKLNLALLVDKSVPAADFAAVQQAVSSAAGIDTKRGDPMQAAQVPFAKTADAEGRPAADLDARPAQVGRPRHRDAAVPVLHDPPPEEARGRDLARRHG